MKKLIIIFALIFLHISGCKNDYPPSLWDPNFEAEPDPVITAIQPDSAFGGIGIITILGENFSADPRKNHVYFNGEKGEVLEASATQLKVRVPNLYGDDVVIKVRVEGALMFAEFAPYKLMRVWTEYSDFNEYDDAFAMAVDADENLYVSLAQDNKGKKKKIVKVTPDGTRYDYASTTVDKASGMRVGPGGDLFYVNILQAVFRVPAGGGQDQIYKVLTGGVFDLDFDANGNIFLAGNASKVFVLQPDKTAKIVAQYDKISFNAVRVFNNYVYLAGSYTGADTTQVQEGVWRNEILNAEGDLGPNELVFDWHSHFPQNNLLSMVIAEDGDIIIGSDTPDPLIAIHPDGRFEPVYPGVIEPPASSMVWGNGDYLYINRRSSEASKKRILRVNMLRKSAPYFGRQ
ncbi:IPT/TIG domain-containing protein [Caldithrix abyssi]|uniref:Cell surface receptor IPT/TIG domain protein n=1 Tax=Caldithrix abyssi DSM 13497 TaxID=880073 RepID=H1XQ93_CALAY|nr:IPT/TIG domain-containing protein [Caldithrix abyssi]APF19514.1 IPT/TIG domain-containing protein [Caldithrix abyssi DSM 13497]EHO43398.1 cell surface receptor IPT/TIG domain protein [Caldithrix abyssi DSM 13497]